MRAALMATTTTLSRVARLAIGVLAAACSNDFGALYDAGGDGGTRTEPSVTQDDLPALPARPDEAWVTGCERCAADTCKAERAECLKDDACIDELLCKGRQKDPAGLQACSALHGYSGWYADYVNCVFGKCATECNTGANWGCQRSFDWPTARGGETLSVILHFKSAPTRYQGARVDTNISGQTAVACSDVPECTSDSEHSRGQVGIDNTVKLEVSANTTPPLDFRGYFEIAESQLRLYPIPVARSQDYFTPATNLAGFELQDLTLADADAAEAHVLAVVTDCLSLSASRVRVSIPSAPEVEPSYFGGTDYTTPFGLALLPHIALETVETPVIVQARAADQDEIISERSIYVIRGGLTRVELGPAARSE